MKKDDLMKDIVALAKRRGIIYPNSEIYGGFANTWDYGPYGVLLKNNVKQAWWQSMVQERSDIVGLDSAILMNPKVWEASGHLKEFSDLMLECEHCNVRHKFPDAFSDVIASSKDGSYRKTEGMGPKCPSCGEMIDNFISKSKNPKQFNLMFQTFIGPTAHKEFQPEEADYESDGYGGGGVSGVVPERHIIEYDPDALAYLRPETAQGIFTNFKNVLDSTRVKLPFGIAQIGKAFRNEITPGNFTFRTLEFEQFELEYFVYPDNANESFKEWVDIRFNWYVNLGINKDNLAIVPHPESDLAHYATAVTDIEYKFPFGQSELEGIANRADFDLKQHQKTSNEKLVYTNDEGEKIMPYVIEPSGGVDRAVLAFLVDAYKEEEVKPSSAKASDGQGGEKRVVLSLHPKLAPIKAAILPLVKKDEGLVKLATSIFDDLKSEFFVEYDDGGTIGKRYRRQDEIGTPFCITIDSDSLENNTVTIRHRDDMTQETIKVSDLKDWLKNKL